MSVLSKNTINPYITKDFPIKGVNFIDIFPLVRKYQFRDLESQLNIVEPIVLVPEARGFLFYKSIGAQRIVPLRKEGKLPGKLVSIPIHKEYGFDTLFFQENSLKSLTKDWLLPDVEIPVAIFDDILATGGTAKAIADKINSIELDGKHFKVTNFYFYLEIVSLEGRKNLDAPTFSLYQY